MSSDFLIDLFTLDDHLIDINNPPDSIPEGFLDTFWNIKSTVGSLALGIAYYPENGWFIVDSMGSIVAHSK